MDFWNSIKEQSAAALEVVSKDLQEFTATVSTDTAAYLQGENSDNVQNEKGEVAEEDKSSSAEADDGSSSTSTSLMSLTSGLAAGLEGISDSILKTAQSILDTEEEVEGGNLLALPTLTVRERVIAAQGDPNTYSRPIGPKYADKYEEFCSQYTFDEKRRSASSSLLQDSTVQSIYHELVPAEVEETEFWRRYFFWEAQIIEEEKGKEEGQGTSLEAWDDMDSPQKSAKVTNSPSSNGTRDESLVKEPEIEKPAATTKREDSTESWTVVDETNEKEKNADAATDGENAKAGEADTAKKSVGASDDEGGDGWDEWE